LIVYGMTHTTLRPTTKRRIIETTKEDSSAADFDFHSSGIQAQSAFSQGHCFKEGREQKT
jgi:hypothetical protein